MFCLVTYILTQLISYELFYVALVMINYQYKKKLLLELNTVQLLLMGFCFVFSYYFSRTTVAVILPLEPSASTIDCGKSNDTSTVFSPSFKFVKSIGLVVI